jgi:hypothetical protein
MFTSEDKDWLASTYCIRSPVPLFLESIITYLLTYLLTPWCRILFEKLIVTQIIKKYFAFFMEPEGSSPSSQKPAIRPYPKPAESSSPHPSRSPYGPS